MLSCEGCGVVIRDKTDCKKGLPRILEAFVPVIIDTEVVSSVEKIIGHFVRKKNILLPGSFFVLEEEEEEEK